MHVTPLKFRSQTQKGMTMIESLVIISIIAIVSAVVLASFSGMNEGIALNRAARELTLRIRKAQQIALAVRQISGSPPPPRAGVNLTRTGANANKYTLFADMDNTDADPELEGNYFFNASPDLNLNQLETGYGIPVGVFERGIVVSALKREDGTDLPYDTINILFSSPEANVDFSDQSGNKFTNTEPYIAITLKSPGGKTKKVIVRSSGQITVQ